MKVKGKFGSFIKGNRKKCTALAALALCIGAYTITGQMMNGDEPANDDIPLHDGDVLVTSDEVAEPENTDSYFQELRATLDMDRNKIISMLSDAEGSASTSEDKEKAAAEKMKLLDYMEQEKTIETLISNKGLPDTFVVITDSGVNVTVNSEQLDQPTVTKICEIIMRQTEWTAEDIVVQGVDSDK